MFEKPADLAWKWPWIGGVKHMGLMPSPLRLSDVYSASLLRQFHHDCPEGTGGRADDACERSLRTGGSLR